MITAPFNFVPLSEKVFFPEWSEQVSHDIPFSDGESGVIDITITAKSPIFVRNHYVKGDDFYIDNGGNKISTEFCHYKGTPYIPATSVKGMLCNVLEIMSFGKMKLDTKTHQKTMSVRDMTNRKELVGTANGCGLLKQDENGKWIIIDYGKPRTIEYTNRRDKTIQNGNETINCNFDTVKEKYSKNGLYKRVSIQIAIKDLYKDGKKIGIKNIATIHNGQETAYLILTGSIDNKKNEFIFADSDKQVEAIKDIDEVVKKFKKVYFESDSIDGNFWRDNWDRDIGIPIFYMKKNGKITDIGLSQLFKLAYNFTINEATKQILETIKKDNKEFVKLDLAETIFGTISQSLDKKENDALKGRVQFSHFKLNNIPQSYGEVYTVLGSPNPSFYPEYISQNCQKNGKVQNDSYNTLMKQSSKIAGWKRYPLRYCKPNVKTAEEGTDSATRFKPLGTYDKDKFNEFSFSGKIRFHNLKKVELGALLSALSFHSNQDSFYHNIGMAKSLGFGKIKVDIDTDKYKEHLIEFELAMDNWTKDNLQKDWIKTEQIKELLSMAYKDLNIDNKLEYLKLDPDKKINKFVDVKKEKKCLLKVSEMFDIGKDYPNSLLTKELLEKIEEKKQAKKTQDEFNNKLNLVQKEFEKDIEEINFQIIENFIISYPKYQQLDEIKDKLNEFKKKKEDNKEKEINKKFDSAYQALEQKKQNPKQYQKELDKFLNKWNKKQNHKNSKYILELLKTLS